jgi:lipopolysaccharide/colanic/teichoic acid biosynthesis glycosyltransferase
MKRHLHHINPFAWLQDAKVFNRVHSSKVFASILNRERDRADRTGQEFSIAVFDVGNGKRKSDSARNLVPILTHRIRSTDSIGWLKDGRIGAILPHTPPESAWLFVANIRNAYQGTVPPPDCRVYVYPSSRLETTDRARPIDQLESHVLARHPAWKRAVDVAGSIAALILLSPLLLLVALFIKTVSPGPILFRQERVGFLGRVFTMWKFRTMHVNADAAVHRDYLRELIHNEKEMTKLDNGRDHRIIPFGNLLRATGIDELPQLINVLLGDMSLVGPRPCLPYEACEYHLWQMRRFDAVPGLTGLWQVSGKNRTTFKEMMRLDIGYARKRSFPLDLLIFLKTIPAIILQVADRQSSADARSKELSAAIRVCALLFAILAVNSPRR